MNKIKRWKPKKVKTEREKLFDLYTGPEYGMSVRNAALKAGYTPKGAEDKYIAARALQLMNITPLDIAEQEGLTLRKAIRRMIEKAGFKESEGLLGTQKFISAHVVLKREDGSIEAAEAGGRRNDFVEVPDEYMQFKYLQELLEVAGIKKKISNNELDPEANGKRSVNIEINILGEDKKLKHDGPVIDIDKDND